MCNVRMYVDSCHWQKCITVHTVMTTHLNRKKTHTSKGRLRFFFLTYILKIIVINTEIDDHMWSLLTTLWWSSYQQTLHWDGHSSVLWRVFISLCQLWIFDQHVSLWYKDKGYIFDCHIWPMYSNTKKLKGLPCHERDFFLSIFSVIWQFSELKTDEKRFNLGGSP